MAGLERALAELANKHLFDGAQLQSLPSSDDRPSCAQFANGILAALSTLSKSLSPAYDRIMQRILLLLRPVILSSEVTSALGAPAAGGAGSKLSVQKVPWFALASGFRSQATHTANEIAALRDEAQAAVVAKSTAEKRAEVAIERIRELRRQLASLGVSAEASSKEMEDAKARRHAEEEQSMRRNVALAGEVSQLRAAHASLHAEVVALREQSGSTALTKRRFESLEVRRRRAIMAESQSGSTAQGTVPAGFTLRPSAG